MTSRRTCRTVFAIAAITVSSLACAQGYIGVGAGRSSTRFDSGDFSLNSAAVSESQDDRDTAYKIFAGYDFTRNWAVEGGYAHLGKPTFNYSGTGVLAGTSGQAEAKETAWFLAGKGTWPINDQFNVFGKLGASWNKLETTASSNSALLNTLGGLPRTDSHNKTDVYAGIGAEYLFNKQVGLRLEYEDFGKFGDSGSTGRTRANMWTLGVNFRSWKF